MPKVKFFRPKTQVYLDRKILQPAAHFCLFIFLQDNLILLTKGFPNRVRENPDIARKEGGKILTMP